VRGLHGFGGWALGVREGWTGNAADRIIWISKRFICMCNRRRFAVPTVRRIIVGVHGSLGSLQALRSATEEARLRNVPVTAVIAWLPPGGDLAERRSPSPYLRKVWRDAAWQRLWAAFDAGLGGLPADIEIKPVVARGEAGPVLAGLANRADDLLILGTGRRGPTRSLRRSVARYCLRHAACQVLAVPPTQLMSEVRAGWHPFRHTRVPATVPAMDGN